MLDTRAGGRQRVASRPRRMRPVSSADRPSGRSRLNPDAGPEQDVADAGTLRIGDGQALGEVDPLRLCRVDADFGQSVVDRVRGRVEDGAHGAVDKHQVAVMSYCIEQLGPERCMFESNFPVDKVSFSHHVLFNAFKRFSKGYSAAERANLFHDTAARAYRII